MAETDTTSWFAEDVATLGDRLTHAREAAGLTTEALARRFGVRTATMRAWEEDQREPRANQLQMLAGLLNVSIRWMLTGEGDGMDEPSETGILSDSAQQMLAELSRMRAQTLALASRMGQLEKRLRSALREEA